MAVYLQDVDKGKKKKEEEKKTSAPPKSISVPSVSTPSASIPSASPVTQPAQRQTTSGPPVAVSAIEATAWKQQQDYLDALYRNAYTQYIPNSHAAELNQNMMEQGLAPIYTSNQAAKPFSAADYYEAQSRILDRKEDELTQKYGASQRRQFVRQIESASTPQEATAARNGFELFKKQYQDKMDWLGGERRKNKDYLKFSKLPTDVQELFFNLSFVREASRANNAGTVSSAITGSEFTMYDDRTGEVTDKYKLNAEEDHILDALRKHMSDAEIEEYYPSAKNVWNDSELERKQKEWTAYALKHPIDSTVAAAVGGSLGNALGALGAIGAPGERNSPFFTDSANFTSTVQETVGTEIENAVKKNFKDESWGNFWGGAAKYGYSGAISAVQSAIAMGLGSAVGGVTVFGEEVNLFGEMLLGAGAASQTYNDMLNKGYSYEDALVSGSIAAMIETLTEHVSLENLRWLKASGGGLKNLPINLVKSFVTEGSEEIASDLLNEAWDYFAHGGMSEYYDFVTRYLEEHRGATEAEARSAYAQQFGEQLLESGIIGGFSGMLGAGWTGTANSVRSGIFSNIEGRETGNVYQNVYQRMLQEQARGNTEANPADLYTDLLQTALTLPEGSKARQNLVDMQETFQTESPKKRQVRQQGKAINAALTELNQTEEGRAAAAKYQRNLAVQNWAATGTSDEVVDKSILTRYGVTEETMKKAVDEKKGITAEKIVAIDNGVATVQTSDGSTVRANEAQFKSRDQAALYLAAPKLGYNANTTNDIIQQIDSTRDVPVLQQMLALEEAVRYGRAGTQLTNETMQDNTLTAEQLAGAYTIGRGLTELATQQRQTLLQQARERMVTQQKITVDGKTENIYTVGGLTVDSLNESQKVQAGALMHLAKAVTKNKIILFASELNEDGQRVVKTNIPAIGVSAGDLAPNAAYDRKTGDVYVDINAGQSGQGLMLFHASHEFGHYIKQWNPAKFLAMQDFLVKEVYGDKLAADLIRDQMDKANANGRTLTQEEAAEEMVADALQEMLTRGDAMEKIAKLKQQDRSLWQKLKDFLTDMAKRIREIYKGVNPESREAKELREAGDAIQRLADMFAEGLVEAGENFEAIGNARSVVELKENDKFSMRGTVEERRDLIAVHNLESDRLLTQITEWGGFPAPSIAITRAKLGHTKFGDTTVLFDKTTIDPSQSRKNAVYSGDAYTPTTPQVQYKVSKKAADRLRDTYYDLTRKYGDRARGLYALGNYAEDDLNRKGLDRIKEDLKDDRGLREVFLREKGLTVPDVETREEPVYAPAATQEEAQKIMSYFMFRDVNGKSLVDEFNGIKPGNGRRVRFASEHEAEIRAAMEKSDVPNVADMSKNEVTRFFLDAIRYDPNKTETVTDTSKRDSFLEQNAEKEGYSAWIDGLLDGLIAKKGIYNGKDMFYPSGNRRSWEQLHYEYNLENIVRAMYDTQEEQGAGFAGNNLFGASAQKYASVEEIRADEDRLRNIDDEEYEKLKSEYVSRLGELADSFARDPSDWRNREAASDLLLEAVMKRKTRDGIAAYLKKEGSVWTRYADYIVDDLINLVRDVRKMPTGYFEAKPARAVYADEIRGVVLPNNADEKLYDALSERGISYLTYERGNDADRIEKVNTIADEKRVKFSSRDASYLKAVEDGDMETAQRMVDEAAKAAFPDTILKKKNGILTKVWHGTTSKFNVFKKGDIGFHFGNKGTATTRVGKGKNTRLIAAYIDITNPIYFDEDLGSWDADYRLARELYEKRIISAEELRSVLITDSGNYKRSTGNANIKLREILVNKGYDGIVYKNWHESNGSDSYIVFNSSQIKSADPVTYDDAGNVIPLSERFNAKNDDIRYSDREAEGTDARTLLSGALMDVAQTDDERKLLTKYQSEIAERNEEEVKLNETRREIRDMMFRKGPRDEAYKKKLSDLKIEAQKSANRLEIYDKRLLKLEATKPLKSVLTTERQNAIEKERARSVKLEMDLIKAAGKESNELRKQLQRQKDASDRKIARLEADIEHRKEMRQKGIDQRASTDLRGRIKSIQKDLQDRLQHGNLHTSVPKGLAQSVIDICTAIDPTGADQNSKAAKRFRDTRDALLQLRSEYDKIDTTDTSGFTDDFRAGFSQAINDLAVEIGKTPLRDMSREQLEAVLLVLQQVRHIIVNTNKLLGIQRGLDVDEMKQNIRDNMDEVRRKGLNHGRESDKAIVRAGGEVLNWEMRWFVNPLRMVREVTGYDNDSELYRLMNDINEGRKKGAFWEMTARKLFAPLTEGKENRKAYLNAAQKTYDFGLKDMDGNELKMSKMQAMTLLLTYEREIQNKDRKHLESPTYIPSVNELRKGNWEKANELAQEMPVMDEKALQKLRDGTSDEWCQRYMAAARKVFNEMSNTALNEVSMELIGRPLATEKAYIPYEVNDDFIKGTDENVTFDRNILNAGFTKEVKKNAPQPLVIRGLNDVLDRHIRGVATYYGTAIPVYNWNKVFGAAEYSSTPVRQAVTQAWGKKTVQALRRAVADAQGARHGDTLPLFGRIKSNWVQATLAFNISVWMKQAASYPTAGAYLSAKALAKGLPYFGKSLSEKQRQAIYDEIDKYTAENYMRRTGMEGTQEMAEFSQQKGRIKQASDALGNISPLNWIQSMDIRTTAALWVACKAQVEQDGTRPDADDYWQKVTDLYETVIENTQPMYDPMHRAEIAKNKVAQNFIVFQTQPIQNSGILREAYFERRAAARRFGKDSAELKAANKKFMKACTSQLASHMVFALMTAVAAAALHRVDPWRDDDDELTFGSAAAKYGTDVLNAVVGAVFPVIGNYVVSLLDNVIAGHGYDILSDPVVDQVNSLITSIQNLKDPSYKTVSNAITTVLAMFGVPAANAQRIVEGIVLNAEDIINGHAFTFEAGVSRTTAQERNRLYEALVSGDQAKVGEIKTTFKTEEEYHKAVRQTLTEHDDRIQAAVEARQDMDMQSYTSILNEIIDEGVFSRDDVLQAAESANSAYNSAVKAAYTAQQVGDEKAFQQKIADIVAKGYDEEAFRQAVKDYVPKETDGEDEDKEVQWLSASDTKAFLYKALLENDTSTVAILKQAFDTEKKYHNAIVSALKENDPRIRAAAEARLKGDSSEYLRITKQIIAEQHFTQDDIVKAVNGVMSSIKSGAEEDENATVTPWWEDESESGTSFGFKKADLQNAFASGDRQDIELVISEITADAVAKGKTQEDAQSSAESTVASALKDLYLNDGIDAAGVKTYLKRYSGDDDNDVYWILDNWDYAKENGKDASYGKYLKFYEAVQTGKNLKSEVQRYLTHGVKKETLASQITSYFKPIYKDMNNTQRAALKGYLLNAYAALGYNRYKKSKDIDKWLKN